MGGTFHDKTIKKGNENSFLLIFAPDPIEYAFNEISDGLIAIGDKIDELTSFAVLSFGSETGYDTRLGRRWQLDPEPIIGVSGYSAFNDNPILYADPDGKFPIIPIIVAAVAYYSSAKIMERSEGNANLRTAGYSMLHPINASQVYFKSNVAATNFQVNIGRVAGLNNRDGRATKKNHL